MIIMLCGGIVLLSSDVSANTYLWENITWQENLAKVVWSSVSLGDINNDNYFDLALIGCNNFQDGPCSSYRSKIYINNGTSLAENTTWQSNLTAVHYGSIAWGDVDNDGDLDLALTGCNSGGGNVESCGSGGVHSFLYINNGTSLVENSTWKGDVTDVWKSSIAFGDINNDGKLDLVLTGEDNSNSQISKVYINNGTGFEENSTWQQDLTGVYESSVVFGNIDDDSYLDLILAGKTAAGGGNHFTEVYINNGTSLAANSTWSTNLLDVSKSATSLGDYDNDGDLDLTLIGIGDYHRIYNNTGSSFLQLQKEPNDLIGIFRGSLAFGDYDNDGDLDLLVTGNEGYTTLYLFNNSSSLFTIHPDDPESSLMNLENGPSSAWNDIDNDSDLDLVLVGYHASPVNALNASIYINNITTKNTLSAPPTDFNTSYNNNQLTIQWNNASDAETATLGLYYNIKVGNKSNNHSIVSGVYGGGDDNGYFGNMMQRKSITLSIPTIQAGEVIYWSVQTIDTGLKAGNWSTVQNYTLPLDVTRPTITLNLPVDYNNSSSTTIDFNASVTDDTNTTNVTLYGNWSGWHANETNSTTGNETSFIFSKDLSGYGDGVYLWLIEAYDATNNSRNSSIRTFRIDTTNPLLNSVTPINASSWTTSNEVTFTYNITDLTITNCSLIINDVVNLTERTITSGTTQTFSQNLSNGEYYWGVNCSDSLDQKNGTEVWNLTVSYTAPATGGSATRGGSSGGDTTTKQSVSFSANTGETKTVSFTKDFSITDIAITLAAKISSTKITVEQLSSSDSTVTSAGPIGTTGSVYKYLKITSQAVNENIEKAKIKFKVLLSWLDSQNYDEDKVTLRHFSDNKWNSLPTKKVKSELPYTYYEAEASSFSLFAITAEKKVKGEVEESVTEEPTTETTQPPAPGDVKESVPEKKPKSHILLIAGLIFVVFGYLIYYKIKKKKKDDN